MTVACGVEWRHSDVTGRRCRRFYTKMGNTRYAFHRFCSGEAISDLIRDELSWLIVK